MSIRGFQRAVRSQRFDRATGDAPSIGRVGRVPGTGLPKGELRRKRRHGNKPGNRDRNSRRKVLMVWSSLLALVALAVIGTAMGLWLQSSKLSSAQAGRQQSSERRFEERVVSRFESPPEETALGIVRRALAVRNVTEVTGLFHLGTASREGVIEFLRKLEAVDGVVTGCDWLSSMDANGLLLDGVVVNTQSGGTTRSRLAILTPNEAGQWKIDFDAFARTVKPSWTELMSSQADQALVRVIIAADSYFNGPFKDDERWSCYGMASPDIDVTLLGYCLKGSPQAEAMERILADGKQMTGERGINRATLEIRRTAGGESRQFEITRVVAEDWVVSARPFERSHK